MKKLKIFPKTFLYTLSLMLIIVLLSHTLIYFLMPWAYAQRVLCQRDFQAVLCGGRNNRHFHFTIRRRNGIGFCFQSNFLRAASHELKTPVTAVSAMLENMILGIGKYKDRDTYLAKCKALTDRLAQMIKEILDASRAEFAGEQEQTDFLIADVLGTVMEPYQIIAKATVQMCRKYQAISKSWKRGTVLTRFRQLPGRGILPDVRN